MMDCETAVEPLAKRDWVYVQRPADYGMPRCECGNVDPDWSEFQGRLWCAICRKDYVPVHAGVFDGPIPVHTSMLLGMCFDRFNLQTNQVEKFDARI